MGRESHYCVNGLLLKMSKLKTRKPGIIRHELGNQCFNGKVILDIAALTIDAF
jgi:hypothetical protein